MSYRFVIIAVLAGGFLSTCVETPSDASAAYTAEIIRDNYGIPHIYGKTDADAVYGMIYAQAEETIFGRQAGSRKSRARRLYFRIYGHGFT